MDYDVLVVGAGVTGCATAMELTKYTLRAGVLEAGEDVCTGTSKANSAIVHAGFDALPGSLKARFNVEGSRLMPALARRLDIPYRRNGALVLAFSPEERAGLEELLRRGRANGVEGLELLDRQALRQREPRVSPEAWGALYAPSSAIVCPFELTAAMAENAAANGARFHFGARVTAVKNVSINEEIFAHCPDDYAVLPESLLCEITAQSGCACVLSRPENAGKIGYFMSIDKAESFAPVYPGDQLVIDVDLPEGKSKFGKGTGTITVGGKLVFQITLMFAIVDA